LRQLTAQGGVPAQGQLGLDAVFQRGEPQLGEPGDLGLRERLEGKVGQRLAAPQRQCAPQQRCRLLRCAVEKRPRLSDQPLEPDGVDLVRIQGQEIAGLPGEQQPTLLVWQTVGFQAASQVRHVGLQGVGCAVGRLAVPQELKQPVG
jgi:hypothetical protein